MQKEILETIHIKKKPRSLVVITGELPFEEREKHRTHAVLEIAKDVHVDGFRKGHVPENILIRTVGEMAILNEMAERALSHAYPEIVTHRNLDVIGYPQISITKLAKDNPLGFTITVSVVPDITLPDYLHIAKECNAEKESKEVTEEELTKQINDILRQKIAYERLQGKAGQRIDTTEHIHDETCTHDAHVHTENCTHESETETNESEEREIALPELTDEYVATLGKPGQFMNVDDFKNKIREHLTLEKERDINSRHRAKITDSIVEKAVLELPQILIDAEINQMLSQMEEDLTRAQLKMADYLVHIKKTKEELINDWTPNAEKRAKLQLILNEIAKKENIVPDPSMIDHEVSGLLEQYKDADEKRVRVYITSVLTNEEVLKKLEETK